MRPSGGIVINLFLLSLFVSTLAAVLTLASCAVKIPTHPIHLDSLLEDVEKKAYVIRQFSAEFTKTRHSSVFDRPLTVTGKLVYQKPGRFSLLLSGDVNIEVLSDGEYLRIVHDNHGAETFRLRGERDLSRFADPLMLLISSLGNGGLRRFLLVNSFQEEGSLTMEVVPGNENHFENTRSICISFSMFGEIKKVKILFADGNSDETVFDSWSMLTENDQEILQLDQKLRDFSKSADFRP